MLSGTEESFRWEDGERIVRFGEDALEDAPSLFSERGFEGYVLLTTERALAMAPALGEGAGEVLHVPRGGVPEAAAAVRSSVGGRPLVALGGGRVVDAAKAIAGVDGLAVAAVPTTLSGAELTRIHRMPEGVDEFTLVRPSVVVAAPELMASQPMPALAASAMNALGHAVEALYAPNRGPVTDLAALRAAALIAGALQDREPDRPALALGAILAGYAIGATSLGVHHVVCQTLVRTAQVPHAETNAVMLPHSVRFMAPRAPQEVGALAEALGGAGPHAGLAAELIAAVSARAGATRLGELGVGEEEVEKAASVAAQRTGGEPDEAELHELITSAL